MSTSPPVVETVSRKRVIPQNELNLEKTGRSTPEFWVFIESMTPDMWASDYLLYILREDPKPSMYGGTNTLEKCAGYIAMPDGTKQPLNSREDIELAIKQKYGGKAYRLILKNGSQRVAEGKCMNEAPPKYPDANPQYTHPLPNAQQNSDNVAVKAMETVANQNPQLINIAIDAVSRAADIVAKSQAHTPVAVNSLDDDLDRQLRRAMLQKFLEPPPPPPDPFTMFLKFKEVMGAPTTNGVKETLELIGTLRSSGIMGGNSGKTSWMDIGREVLPTMATTVRDAIADWRMGVEAQVRGLELSRGMNPPQQAQPQQNPGPAPVNELPPAAAAAPQPQQAPTSEPPFDWLAIKIVEILKEPSYTVDEAVDETLSFLYRSHAPAVALLLDPPKLDSRLSQGPQGLLQLFQHHPVLKQIPVNAALTEFITKFVAAAKDAEAERNKAMAPAPEKVTNISPAPPAKT